MKLTYFTDKEVAGLVMPLPFMLDIAHSISSKKISTIKYILTFTTGGKHCGHSAHYKGLAVDIGLGHLAEGFARDTQRWAMIKGLYFAGFERIEVAPAHIHVDIGKPPDYPSPTFWIGIDN